LTVSGIVHDPGFDGPVLPSPCDISGDLFRAGSVSTKFQHESARLNVLCAWRTRDENLNWPITTVYKTSLGSMWIDWSGRRIKYTDGPRSRQKSLQVSKQ
jgi:hypothetical protein